MIGRNQSLALCRYDCPFNYFFNRGNKFAAEVDRYRLNPLLIKQLRAQGFAEDVLPSRSCMSEVLNRKGYRLRPVIKAKPQKKTPKPTPSLPTSSDRTELAKAKP